MVVNRSHADTWKVQAETLWEDAVKNVKNLLPAEFVTMNHALKSLLGDVEYEEGDLLLEKKKGDAVKKGDVLGYLHANDEQRLEAAKDKFLNAYAITDSRPETEPLIKGILQ